MIIIRTDQIRRFFLLYYLGFVKIKVETFYESHKITFNIIDLLLHLT